MKQLSLLFFTFFLTAFCNAQKTDIQYGPFSKDIIIMDPVIGVTPQSIYTSHHSSLYNSFTLSKFSNKTLELLSDLYIDEPKIDKQFINYDTILIYKGKPVLFASKYYSKTKVHNAYAFVINENGVLDSAKLITTESIKSKKKLGEYEYKLSEDGNKIIQYYCYKFPKVKMDSTLLSVKVMDRDLNEIWKKQFNFPHDNSRCDISPPLLDTKNNLYFHMRLTLRNKDNVSQINELLHYRKDNDETKHIPLNIENNFFKSYSVKLNKEDRIVVLGTYSKDPPTVLKFMKMPIYQYDDGVFCFAIDQATDKIIYTENYDLKTNLPDYLNYYFDNHVILDNGTVMVIGEFRQTKNGVFANSSGQPYNRIYTYENIQVVGFNTHGKKAWLSTVKKYQRLKIPSMEIPEIISYVVATHENSISLIYNEVKKGEEESIQLIPTITTINNVGKIDTRPLLEDPGKQDWIYTWRQFQVSNRELILYNRGGKEGIRLERIRFNRKE